MPCQPYKEALNKAAVGGIEPQGELRAHLAGCAACRTAFEEERALFTAIDDGLQFVANSEVPPSLMPRARARLDAEPSRSRGWVGNWLVLASAATIVAGIVVARTVWRPVVRENPSVNFSEKKSPAPVIGAPHGDRKSSEQSANNNTVPTQRIVAAADSPKTGRPSARRAGREVIVPKDQEILLAEYSEQWHQRKHAPLAAQDSDATIFAPLEVAQIQIAGLDVKPLAEEKSQ
jgi:hypothetical protein